MMKIYGPRFGYDKNKGARAFGISFDKTDDLTIAKLEREVARIEQKHGHKVTIMGTGDGATLKLRQYTQKYIQPEWKVPHHQVHFGWPAGDIFEKKDVLELVPEQAPEPAVSKPASKCKRASESTGKSTSKSKPASSDTSPQMSLFGDGETMFIDADLWDALGKIGG